MFLPDPRRRGQIQFLLARSLPYNVRLALIAALLFAGFVCQLYLSLALGAVLLTGASLLGLVKGYSNIPGKPQGPQEWRGADRAQLENILEIARKSRTWDRSLLDVTCWTGLFTFAVIVGATIQIARSLADAGSPWLATACVVDVAVLLVPHWVTGVRRILTNDPLTVKVRELLRVMDLWQAEPRDGEAMLPQMQVQHVAGGEMPSDAKLVLRQSALGDAFLGLQVQVVLNNVQGRHYPYLYCVLVARPSLGLLNAAKTARTSRNILSESKRQEADDVDIVVIRQRTTKTSGYHTRPAECAAIFLYALGELRRLSSTLPSPAHP